MGCTIDNLRENCRVWFLQDFVELGGKKYRAGEYAFIKRLSVEWGRREIVMEWERDGSHAAAGALCSLAASHAFDSDPTVYRWLRDRGIGLWYAWGSGATSGGDGAARAVEIRVAEAKLAALERLARI